MYQQDYLKKNLNFDTHLPSVPVTVECGVTVSRLVVPMVSAWL